LTPCAHRLGPNFNKRFRCHPFNQLKEVQIAGEVHGAAGGYSLNAGQIPPYGHPLSVSGLLLTWSVRFGDDLGKPWRTLYLRICYI